MALERGSVLGLEDQPTHTAVELPRQQQADDGWLDVLLLILVNVEGVAQVLRDVVWETGEQRQALACEFCLSYRNI